LQSPHLGDKAGSVKLRDFPWWPRTWKTTDHKDITPDQVRNDGFLSTSYIISGDLMIEVDYYGKTILGRVGRSLNAPANLGRVGDFLLDHFGESMATVEDLEVTPDRFR